MTDMNICDESYLNICLKRNELILLDLNQFTVSKLVSAPDVYVPVQVYLITHSTLSACSPDTI